jgi:NAD-dependent SIR2 family protein deacetylase
MFGFPRMASVQPNETHHSVAALQSVGLIGAIITQNVDRLHQRAGAHGVLELHGNLQTVHCLSCPFEGSRADMQERLIDMNEDWYRRAVSAHQADPSLRHERPDFDVELTAADYDSFAVPHCPSCGGVLKPSVIFHGGNLPPDVTERSKDMIRSSPAVLVLGTSLTVYSVRNRSRPLAGALSLTRGCSRIASRSWRRL